MRKPTRKREVGRGERVLPGVWRLRLPLPWPGVPHCNAWALAAGDGIVLVDTGMHEPGSMAHLERALDQAGLRLEHVRLVVCTHAHVDHCGQAPAIRERTGAEVWMHPAHGHLHANDETPEQTLARRRRGRAPVAACPEAPLRRWAEQRRAMGTGISGELAVDRDLAAGRDGLERPRRVAGDRDARPRALARVPAPARAPAADLGRPPARPRVAVLRRGPHARPGGRVPRARSTASTRSTPGSRSPATAARSPTSPATSRPTARSSPSASTASARAGRLGRPARCTRVYGEASRQRDVYGDALWLTHLEATRRGLAR